MQGMPDADFDFSFKNFFSPLTNTKAITIISVVGFIIYANMLFNGFVWDDKTYVLTSVTSYGFNITKLFGSNVFNSFGYYRPIPAIVVLLRYI